MASLFAIIFSFLIIIVCIGIAIIVVGGARLVFEIWHAIRELNRPPRG